MAPELPPAPAFSRAAAHPRLPAVLLQAALVLVGAAGTVVGARALMSTVTNSLREGATKLATLAIFWLALFVAVRFVLDSP